MNRNNISQDVLDLVIGHTKEQAQLSVPLYLNYIIIEYFLEIFEQILFRMKFENAYRGGAVTSISSMFFITNGKNDKYCKLSLNIGKDLEIEISLFNSKIKAFGETYSIKSIAGYPWKFDKNVENVKMTTRVNRKTSCDCKNSDGSVELYFRNNKKGTDNKVCPWTDDGCVEWLDSDGLVKLKLKDDINWNSDDKVSIKTYNIDKIEVLENSSLCLACGAYGFGRQCCYWSKYDFYSDRMI